MPLGRGWMTGWLWVAKEWEREKWETTTTKMMTQLNVIPILLLSSGRFSHRTTIDEGHKRTFYFFYDHHHLLAKCRAHKKWIYSFGWTFTYHVFWLLLFIVSVPSFVYDPSVRWWFFLSIRAHNAHLCSLPRNREMIKNKILWGIEKTKASRIHCASDCEFMLVEWKRCVGPCMSWHSMLTSACASITTQTQSHTQRAQPLPLATM